MKPSFSTLACGGWSFAQMIDAALSCGYAGIELRAMNGSLDLPGQPDLRGDGLRESVARLRDTHIKVPCIDTSACLHWSDALKRQDAIDQVLRHVEMAQMLGVPLLRVFPDTIQPGTTRAQTVQWICEGMMALRECLRGSGVEGVLEQHGDFATVEQLAALPGENPMIWDPANAFASGTVVAIPLELQPRIRHVHLKDFTFRDNDMPQYVLPGEGIYPVVTMVAELKRIRYAGFVSFEWERYWHSELAAPEIALPQFIEWWHRQEIV